MSNRVTVSGKLVWFVSLLCLLGGYVSTAQSAASTQPAPTAAPAPDEYWFYTPPTDRSPYPDMGDGEVKNVILLIGDGMGFGPVATARYRSAGAAGRLYMDRMPVTGYVTTWSESGLVTDSAAGATALASGYKTNNGMVGILPDGRRVLTILEAARDVKKMATGLAVICTINHATPAGFAAHVPSRDMYPKIYEQIVQNKVDVLLGNGSIGTATQPSTESTQAKQMGYRVISTRDELRAVTETPVIGLLGIDEPTPENPKPMLAEMTAKAIELLRKDRDGFFLMVEGSDIDWAGHGNDTSASIRKTLLFDLAIKEAVEFALRDKHTLVLVTADHDTGGLTVLGGSLDGKEVGVAWITKGHSGLPVPLYAFGPGARRFMGVHDNTDVPRLIAQLLKIKDFPKVFPRMEPAKQ